MDYDLFEEIIWPVLAQRVRVFEAIKLVNTWAGHYAFNVLDQSTILGRHLEVSNLIFANGYSRRGLQQTPAVGRGIAELIVHGEYRVLYLSAFRLEWFAEGALVKEIKVV